MPYATPGGSCDGCGADIAGGQRVMDCRACNWYLCGVCSLNRQDTPGKGSTAIAMALVMGKKFAEGTHSIAKGQHPDHYKGCAECVKILRDEQRGIEERAENKRLCEKYGYPWE